MAEENGLVVLSDVVLSAEVALGGEEISDPFFEVFEFDHPVVVFVE